MFRCATALLFSIQNFADTLDNEYSQPVLKILVDAFGVDGALAVFSIIMSRYFSLSNVAICPSALVGLDADLRR